jgi:hypothetical protein
MGFDLYATLIPGISAAGIVLGWPMQSVLALATHDGQETRIGVQVWKFGPVWIFAQDDHVSQVCVFAGYQGQLSGGIGIGSRVLEIERALGPLEDLEWGEYGVQSMAGWCFGVAPHSPHLGQPGWEDLRVHSICIMKAN